MTPTALHPTAVGRLLIPRPLRRPLKNAYLQWKLDAALARVGRLSAGEVPSRGLLEELQDAWDNKGMAARTDYLQAVGREAARTAGPILECGSGLTTLIIGMLAGRRGVESWSFEHLGEWRDRVARVVSRQHISGARVCLAPLHDFGGYEWYDAPLAELPPHFRLVVCDGPPGQTRGGRYGLMPIMGNRLREGSTILLDDVDRPGETDVLESWRREAGLDVEVHDVPTGAFAVVRCQGPARPAPAVADARP